MKFAEGKLAAGTPPPKVPKPNATRPSRVTVAHRFGLALALFAATCTIAVDAGSSLSGAGASVTVLQQRASEIAVRIDTVQSKLDVLAEEYDQAKSRQTTLEQQISSDRGKISLAQHTVQHDNSILHTQAINAYVDSGAATDISAVISSNPNALPAQQTYLGIALSSLDSAVASLTDSEHQLSVRQITLLTAERQASAATLTVGQAENAASSLEGQLSTTLRGVKGALASAVDEQEAAQAAQQAATAAASTAASAAGTAAAQEGGGGGLPVSTSGAISGSDPGAAAVAAAQTQLGVPYVWAGASPGGFDCSGLTMWAWGKAGVDLPHSAEEQYNSIEHIPMSEIQPGDLIFYASGGYIYHVIMYVGGGRAIQAIDTGTAIQYTAVWPGAIGAGRP